MLHHRRRQPCRRFLIYYLSDPVLSFAYFLEAMLTRPINPDDLANLIGVAQKPLHINVLARPVITAHLESQNSERLYAPGAAYNSGETIRLDGQIVAVKAVSDGKNPKQGAFKILQLTAAQGGDLFLAAQVPNASSQDRVPVTDQAITAELNGAMGAEIRRAIRQKLDADERFHWFEYPTGDYFCLRELLDKVSDSQIERIFRKLNSAPQDGSLHATSTEDLIWLVWGGSNDGSAHYERKAFSLDTTLQSFSDLRWMGNGWILEQAWLAYQNRPLLVAPRQWNNVVAPAGVIPLDEREQEDDDFTDTPDTRGAASNASAEQDVITWNRNRRQNATFWLQAKQYYGNYLPLTGDLRRVFPPAASGSYSAKLFLHFAPSIHEMEIHVDLDQGRILAPSNLYTLLRDSKIYPGTKLKIVRREQINTYDLQPVLTTSRQTIRVRRVSIVDGELDYTEFDEHPQFEVKKYTFIADARWEDLPALFREADEVGAGFFQLMYDICANWWTERGQKPLYITTNELYEAVHRQRLGSPVTIAWELWRRRAFELQDNGTYLYRPEMLDYQVNVNPRRAAPNRKTAAHISPIKKTRTLDALVRQAQSITHPPVLPAPPPRTVTNKQAAPHAAGDEHGAPPTKSRAVTNLLKPGLQLKTLDDGSIFTIEQMTGTSVKVRVQSSNGIRSIDTNLIEHAWLVLKTKGILSRSEIEENYKTHNAAYVAAMLSKMPGVTSFVDPIRLKFKEPVQPVTKQESEEPVITSAASTKDAGGERKGSTVEVKKVLSPTNTFKTPSDFVKTYLANEAYWYVPKQKISIEASDSISSAITLLSKYNHWSKQVELLFTVDLHENDIISPAKFSQIPRSVSKHLTELRRGPMATTKLETLWHANPEFDDYTANGRNWKSLLEKLGFIIITNAQRIISTGMGKRMAEARTATAFRDIMEIQLVKWQFWNPTVDVDKFRVIKIRPYLVLLRTLLSLDDNRISPAEYSLFISKCRDKAQSESLADEIRWYRGLSSSRRDQIFGQLSDSSLYKQIDRYRSYVFSFVSSSSTIVVQDDGNIKLENKSMARDILKREWDREGFMYIDFSDRDDWLNYYGDPDMHPTKEFAENYQSKRRTQLGLSM